ncbi:MAG: 16S rRNA (cytidine(1402)-2'-O)-methyltransferase [Clostridia bacterium]|nr:16S rRNA (cytidine(1402)-2'-O)-methyltransferase [Clostridia bacterium]
MQPVLYLVGTPIGNLSDISPRVRETLKKVDFIAAEDTRNTLKLLNFMGIKKPLISYFEHNKRQRGEEILKKIEAGQIGALVTDAGMPAVSDPGEDLVALLYEHGYCVTAVAGPCAFVSGLILSGLPTGRFCFEGFLSTAKKSRNEHLESLKNEQRTMIFYESPQKLKNTLTDFAKAFGSARRIALTRELSKMHEEVLRGSIGDMIAYYETQAPRGEYVVIVDGAKEVQSDNFWDSWSVPQHIEHYKTLGFSNMDAVKAVAKDRGVPKNEIYKISVESKE